MFFFFFFNDTATTEIYTLSLHDALPISRRAALDAFDHLHPRPSWSHCPRGPRNRRAWMEMVERSEEHTSELQSRPHLVCRLLLEKKKKHHYLRDCDILRPGIQFVECTLA